MSASLAVAYVSYEFFEKRFLRMKRLFATAKEPRRRARLRCKAPDLRPVLADGDSASSNLTAESSTTAAKTS